MQDIDKQCMQELGRAHAEPRQSSADRAHVDHDHPRRTYAQTAGSVIARLGTTSLDIWLWNNASRTLRLLHRAITTAHRTCTAVSHCCSWSNSLYRSNYSVRTNDLSNQVLWPASRTPPPLNAGPNGDAMQCTCSLFLTAVCFSPRTRQMKVG